MCIYLCRNGFFLVTKFKIIPATLDATAEIIRTTHINQWIRWRRVIAMTHVPLGILIGNRKVQPVGIVRTVWAIALGDVTSEEPRLAIRFAQESDPRNSPVHHCAGSEHIGDGKERIENHGHT